MWKCLATVSCYVNDHYEDSTGVMRHVFDWLLDIATARNTSNNNTLADWETGAWAGYDEDDLGRREGSSRAAGVCPLLPYV